MNYLAINENISAKYINRIHPRML